MRIPFVLALCLWSLALPAQNTVDYLEISKLPTTNVPSGEAQDNFVQLSRAYQSTSKEKQRLLHTRALLKQKLLDAVLPKDMQSLDKNFYLWSLESLHADLEKSPQAVTELLLAAEQRFADSFYRYEIAEKEKEAARRKNSSLGSYALAGMLLIGRFFKRVPPQSARWGSVTALLSAQAIPHEINVRGIGLVESPLKSLGYKNDPHSTFFENDKGDWVLLGTSFSGALLFGDLSSRLIGKFSRRVFSPCKKLILKSQVLNKLATKAKKSRGLRWLGRASQFVGHFAVGMLWYEIYGELLEKQHRSALNKELHQLGKSLEKNKDNIEGPLLQKSYEDKGIHTYHFLKLQLLRLFDSSLELSPKNSYVEKLNDQALEVVGSTLEDHEMDLALHYDSLYLTAESEDPEAIEGIDRELRKLTPGKIRSPLLFLLWLRADLRGRDVASSKIDFLIEEELLDLQTLFSILEPRKQEMSP